MLIFARRFYPSMHVCIYMWASDHLRREDDNTSGIPCITSLIYSNVHHIKFFDEFKIDLCTTVLTFETSSRSNYLVKVIMPLECGCHVATLQDSSLKQTSLMTSMLIFLWLCFTFETMSRSYCLVSMIHQEVPYFTTLQFKCLHQIIGQVQC